MCVKRRPWRGRIEYLKTSSAARLSLSDYKGYQLLSPPSPARKAPLKQMHRRQRRELLAAKKSALKLLPYHGDSASSFSLAALRRPSFPLSRNRSSWILASSTIRYYVSVGRVSSDAGSLSALASIRESSSAGEEKRSRGGERVDRKSVV